LNPKEEEKTYPEPRMFGEMPAYGFFVRHVKGIEFNDVKVSYLKEDMRPPFRLDRVTDVEFNHVKAQRAANVPTFVLNDVENFAVQGSAGIPDARLKSVERKEF
jgi:hypothetical protein